MSANLERTIDHNKELIVSAEGLPHGVVLSFEVPPPFVNQDGSNQDIHDDDSAMSLDSSSSSKTSLSIYFSDTSCSLSDDDFSISTASSSEEYDIDFDAEIVGARDTESKFSVFGLEITFGDDFFKSPREGVDKYFSTREAAQKRARELDVDSYTEEKMVAKATKAFGRRRTLEHKKLLDLQVQQWDREFIEQFGESAFDEQRQRKKAKKEERLRLMKQRKEDEKERQQIKKDQEARKRAREDKEMDEWEAMADEYVDWLDEAHLSILESNKQTTLDNSARKRHRAWY